MRNTHPLLNVVGWPRCQNRSRPWPLSPAGGSTSAPARRGPCVAWPMARVHREVGSRRGDHTALELPMHGQLPREPWHGRTTDQPSPVTLPHEFTSYIEQNYYGQVTEQSMLEAIIHDPAFVQDPLKHVALFSDHGIHHVRDIAKKIVQVLQQINGVFIPARGPSRLEFMLGYGSMLAYLHDIGMKNITGFGRAMHPEFAAQLVFTADFDPLIEVLWRENAGGIAWRLLNLSVQQLLPQPPQLVLREMLALAMCHSKSKVPIATLTDVHRLRDTMQRSVGTDLQYLYHLQQVEQGEKALAQAPQRGEEWPACRHKLDHAKAALQQFQDGRAAGELMHARARHYYQDFAHDAFAWLLATAPAVQELVLDVIDTLRALRCADALRERGTTFRTSAGYEVFMNRHNANAVYALRSRDQAKLFLLEGRDPISAGEANLTSAGLDSEGNLRVSFARGAFATPEAIQWAAHSAAMVIADIQSDVLGSFRHPLADPSGLQPPAKREADMHILVEGVEDNAAFADLVCQELRQLQPLLGERIHAVASLQNADLQEVKRYVDGVPLNWSLEEKSAVLARLAETGQKVDHIALVKAFHEVRVVTVKAGEILLQAEAPSSFVYIPLGDGLRVFPLGTQASFPAFPWVQIGNTGVIRGAMRNARVIAERDVELLSIPKEIYLQYWYTPYTVQEFTRLCAHGHIQSLLRPALHPASEVTP